MSVAEIKAKLSEMTAEERAEVREYLKEEPLAGSGEERVEMARRLKEMLGGNFTSQAEATAIHERLTAEGR